MDKQVSEQKSPVAVEVKKGETYYFCTCGKSSNFPFCDGSHQGTSCNPLAYTAEKDDTVYICACGESKNSPFFDGTHCNL